MTPEYPKKFEKIDNEINRLKVSGGWIIRIIVIMSKRVSVLHFL